eukprot:2127938-Amphidinium_carterae.1
MWCSPLLCLHALVKNTTDFLQRGWPNHFPHPWPTHHHHHQFTTQSSVLRDNPLRPDDAYRRSDCPYWDALSIA